MKRAIKKMAINYLQSKGFHIAKTTPASEVWKVVNLLKPIDSGIELIRVGGDYDGGYLLPDALAGIKHCFSPGVADVSTFEHDCLERGIVSFLADYSVDAPPIDLSGCKFTKKYVGALSNDEFMSLDEWITESLPDDQDSEMILQMDIEGAEYEALLATAKATMRRFRIMILEFHNMESLRDINYFNIVLATLRKIREDFDVVHLHPNNCCGISSINGVEIPNIFEVTFLRKDYVKSQKPVKSLPHPLDQANLPLMADLGLPEQWAWNEQDRGDVS